jgi:hypothetical protein
MTNQLAEQLGIDAKKLPHLLTACGMTEEAYDLEALKAVIAMRESGEATGNRQGYCLYLAQQYRVNAEEIHKAIEPTNMKTSEKDYLPLFINVCNRVAAGETAIQAVEAEFSQPLPTEQDADELPEEVKVYLRDTTKAAVRNVVFQAIAKLGSYQEQASAYLNQRIEIEMNDILRDPEVKQATAQLIANSSPGKLPLLEASLVESVDR